MNSVETWNWNQDNYVCTGRSALAATAYYLLQLKTKFVRFADADAPLSKFWAEKFRLGRNKVSCLLRTDNISVEPIKKPEIQ